MDDMATTVYVMIMAIVQGIAEFLPISSSGHLLLLGKFFELPEILTLSILLHAGTLLSVLVYFWRDIFEACTKKPRMILLVIVGTIPTVVVAFGIMGFASFLEESVLVAGLLFIVTGVLLVKFLRNETVEDDPDLYFQEIERIQDEMDGIVVEKSCEETSFLDAIIVGIAQGVAALPGLSRSGTTIATGVARGFDREWAAKFSFLLSIPVIGGGAILEIIKLFKDSGATSFGQLFEDVPHIKLYFLGSAVSCVVGLLALAGLMRLLKSGKLHYFAWWLFIVGPACVGYCVYEHWSQIVAFLN